MKIFLSFIGAVICALGCVLAAVRGDVQTAIWAGCAAVWAFNCFLNEVEK